jgi:hypothetical protein
MRQMLKLCGLLTLLHSNLLLAAVPFGNSTWAYDNLYSSAGEKEGFTAGLFASNIANYNAIAKSGHTLSQVFSYGGSMEMYCGGSGGTSTATVCNASNMFIYYQTGQQSTTAYYNVLTKTATPVSIIPIVDGQINATGSSDYLSALNKLDQPTAIIYADKVAAAYCADPMITGVQFDLEPFDISQSGQLYFFRQIAKDFAGKHNPSGVDPLKCVDSTHPTGRIFSVFTTAAKITQQMAKVLNTYSNGYVVDALYDLGPNSGGIASTPVNYGKYAKAEIIKLMAAAKLYKVNYQIGVPAAASVHEFETKAGVSTGYKQVDYVTQAFNAITANKVRADRYFKGINLWSWNDKFFWNGDQYTPQTPSTIVQTFLMDNL